MLTTQTYWVKYKCFVCVHYVVFLTPYHVFLQLFDNGTDTTREVREENIFVAKV